MDKHDRQHEKQTEIEPISTGKSPLESFGTVIFVVVVVQIILLAGLNLYQKGRINTLTQSLEELKAELSSASYRTLQTQVEEVLRGSETLKSVLSTKVKWSNFYRQFNAVTPRNVRLTTLNITESGFITGEGRTTSLSALAQALVAWQSGAGEIKSPLSSVSLINNGYITEGSNRLVSFSITGQINIGGLK